MVVPRVPSQHRSCVSGRHSGEMTEGPPGHGKKSTDLVSLPFLGSRQGHLGMA